MKYGVILGDHNGASKLLVEGYNRYMQITIIRCDRCGAKTEREDPKETGWVIHFWPSEYQDLCKECENEWNKLYKEISKKFNLPTPDEKA